jgi:hypothetical protein
MSVMDTLFLGKQMRRTLHMMQVLRHNGELGDASEANRILGAPTTTLRDWCERQRLHSAGNRTSLAEQEQPGGSTEGVL